MKEKLYKFFRFGTNIILILLILGAIQMFFDENASNDNFGWLILPAFWMIISLKGFISSVREGKKIFALVDLFFVFVICYFILSRSMNYFI